ncbi:hypothetical protein N657DRAFT_564886 [Parathielavia appendiculata]|uniref:Uncharacterized protein n=1 Tax=Parathielavia appendiculata TaxID=2587402 RepID=A0AAN6Z6G2_9PEZI|nr:hypothetical protein N657DRAFT_564886 [Parathielavia appendiculata]
MDDNRGQRRQNEPPTYPPPSSRPHHPLHEQSQQRRPFPGTQGERFRAPAPLGTTPSGTRGMGGGTGYSGYYQDTSPTGYPATAMAQGAMGYHQSTADYGQPDSRQAAQSYGGSYTPAMMYNVQQTGGPQSAAVYDTSQQYPSRQAAGLPMLATDVTTPYFPSEPTNAAAAGPGLQAQTASPSTPQVYQQPGLHGYSAGSMAAIGGMASQTTPAADVRMDAEYPAPGLEEGFNNYMAALRECFRNIRGGVLATAGESLLRLSDWLLSHVVELGFTSDNQQLHDERIKMWNDFNHAWLALLQKQKEMMEAGQPLQRPQSLVPQEGLQKMGDELVRMCDSIERHGLVDYQYGVWEEQIVEILGECLDLYSPSSASGGGGEGSSSNNRR